MLIACGPRAAASWRKPRRTGHSTHSNQCQLNMCADRLIPVAISAIPVLIAKAWDVADDRVGKAEPIPSNGIRPSWASRYHRATPRINVTVTQCIGQPHRHAAESKPERRC